MLILSLWNKWIFVLTFNSILNMREEWTSRHLHWKHKHPPPPSPGSSEALMSLRICNGKDAIPSSEDTIGSLYSQADLGPCFTSWIYSWLDAKVDWTDIWDMSATVLNNVFSFYLPNSLVRFIFQSKNFLYFIIFFLLLQCLPDPPQRLWQNNLFSNSYVPVKFHYNKLLFYH